MLKCEGWAIEGDDDDDDGDDNIQEHVKCISSTLQDRYVFVPPKANESRSLVLLLPTLTRIGRSR
jgi:hypothetical protein